jgi:hypothetical protein
MISPMEVAKIGLQLDRENKFKNNSIEFIKHIHKTKGFSGLYSGWAGMQWRQVKKNFFNSKVLVDRNLFRNIIKLEETRRTIYY